MKKNFILTVTGTILSAMAFGCFILPAGLPAGGVTGLAVLVQEITHISLSLLVWIISGFFFLAGRMILGKQFAMKTLISFLLFSPALKFFQTMPFSINPVTAAVTGGIVLGSGAGLILVGKGSSGSFDVLAAIIQKYTGIKPNWIMCGCDLVIMYGNAADLAELLPGVLTTMTACFTTGVILHIALQDNKKDILLKRRISSGKITQMH